jgi:ribosome maturation factor RimP
VRALTKAPIEAMGYELVDVEFTKEHNGYVLTLYIDKPGGVGIEDCERVSREIDPLIEERDPIPQAYYLSVSSPGIDRPLKTERDYLRNTGKKVTIKLYAKRDDKKEFTGELVCFANGAVTIACNDGHTREFQLKELSNVKPYIDF